MKLYLCEKPSQAKDIAKVLKANERTENCFQGDQIQVTWCIGHLLSLAPPDAYCETIKPWRMEILPIVPVNWKVVAQEKSKKQLNAIGKLLKQAKTVVIATDADREGDVIGREVLDYFNYTGNVERLWLSALDEASIKKALGEIRAGKSTENLYQAGLARQRADWMMGMNLTMAASCLFGKAGQGVLSVGRVQTPTLKLVVDRDLSIEHFKSYEYTVLRVLFKTKTHEHFWTNWNIPEELSDEEGRCTNQALIKEIAKKIDNQQGIVTEFNEAQKKTVAPLCLSLSALQKLASAQFGFSAKETLDLAQLLYEKYKATTYPRTDCGYLPESQFTNAAQILDVLKTIDKDLSPLIKKCNVMFKSTTWNDKKITAHHGIIPTLNTHVDINSMLKKERQVYELIRAHYLAQFLGDYEYKQRQVVVAVDVHSFGASCHIPMVFGWKEAIKEMENHEDINEARESYSLIPILHQEERLLVNKTKLDNLKTKPAARFTEGTLITAMKSIAKYVDDKQLKKILKDTAGIGTEATRANILETLVNRDYIKRSGKQLISTSKGRELVTLLPSSITNPVTTALWEQVLDEIANGQKGLNDFLDDQRDILEGLLEQLADM